MGPARASRAPKDSNRPAAWLVALFVVGCATGGGHRDDGDEPRDEAARRQLAEIASFRAGGHAEASLATLDRLLKQLSSWGGDGALAPATRAALVTELDASRAFVRDLGSKEVAEGRPLAAEAELARFAPLLNHDELAGASEAARARARDAGRAVCERVRTSAPPDAPHVGVLVNRYCAHFGVASEGAPVASATTFALTGAVTGSVASAGDHLRARIEDWLRSSAWIQSGGQDAASGTMQGKVDGSVTERSVTLHATYRERVVTETGSTQQAAELPQPLRALVDKNASSSVTEMDRDYAYDAEERTGRYELGVQVRLALGQAPVAFTLQRSEVLKGWTHQVSFPPAGVAPRRDVLPTSAEWLDRQLDRMSTKVVALLNRKFAAAYCTPPAASLEDASRCIAGGQRSPAAFAVISGVFGEDVDTLVPILLPPPPASKRAAPPKAKLRPPEDDNTVID